jgi:hypothetical protein
MKIRTLIAAGLLITGFGAVILPAGVAGATPTVLVVGTSPGCTGTYTTISAAVAAAASGDTIQVCAGTYDETVNVGIPDLTFEGAQTGQAGSAGRASKTAKESVVSDVNGDFILASNADNTTIDGFTLEGAGSPTVNQDAIEAFAGSSGLDVTDSVIVNNGNGINLQNPDGTEPGTISDNYIFNNNSEGGLGTNGSTGTGVFISNGPANDTSISNNVFGDDSQTAINFAGSSTPSVGLVVADNTSINDSTFVVAINSSNATIESNKITVNGVVPGGNGTGILDFGGNTGLHVVNNVMSSNADISAAIALTTYAGSASVGTTVTGNKVKGWNEGVYVAPDYTTALVSTNKIRDNGAFGIEVDTDTSGNVISQNKISKDSGAAVDCSDVSTGYLTDGTGNTWLKNVGRDHNSSPAGIC